VQLADLTIATVFLVVDRHAGADLRLSVLSVLALGMGAKSALARAMSTGPVQGNFWSRN
jgi:hypothetical protein